MRVAGRQATAGRRLGPLADLAQPIGACPNGPPARPAPRIGRAELQDRGRHRQQRVQIERARPAAPDPGHGARVVRFHPRAELPRQDAAAGDRQVSPLTPAASPPG